MSDRYTILSSDCHAGADHATYRTYLASEFHAEFDDWRGQYANPFTDLREGGKVRNWDDELRTNELHADGVVGEVVFPNTVPPFFPTGQIIAYPPSSAESYRKRRAGIRAHNRWLVDFCAERPGQRIGLPQIFLNDVDDAVADARWAAEQGFTSILIPAIPPDLGIPAFYTDAYEALWATCADLGLVVTQHGGSGIPRYPLSPAVPFLMLMEVPFFANRTLWHLIFTGVFERHPDLLFVMTEQGVGWLVEALQKMDGFHDQVAATGKVGELEFDRSMLLPRRPSEYFASNVRVGASFPGPTEAAAIRKLGVEHFMWGNDYPHAEGTYPHSLESLRRSFSDWTSDELDGLLGRTAAEVYRADLGVLDALAAEHGPTREAVAEPLDEIPDNESPAFTRS